MVSLLPRFLVHIPTSTEVQRQACEKFHKLSCRFLRSEYSDPRSGGNIAAIVCHSARYPRIFFASHLRRTFFYTGRCPFIYSHWRGILLNDSFRSCSGVCRRWSAVGFASAACA